jgi:type II secretory pathway component PulF
MPTYQVRCLSESGHSYSMQLEAPSLAALRQTVERHRGFLVAHREVRSRLPSRRIRLSATVRAQLFNLLALQLENGVQADLAVTKLKDEFPDRQAREVLSGIHAQLSSARLPLSDAMSQYPRSFPEGVIAAIKAGEQAGAAGLAERFRDLRDQIRFRLRIRKAAIRAVAYPIFILVFAAAVLGLLLVRLIPLIEELLSSLNAELPPLTKLILRVSAWARHDGAWFALVAVAVLATIHFIRFWPRMAGLFDLWLLRVPLAGGIFRALVTADVAKTYRALYRAGASASESLATCAAVVGNRALRAALLQARDGLDTGELTAGKPDSPAITEALRSTGYFPELALTIISTGESSGGLTRALDTVAEYYAEEAQERIAVFFAIFDKVLMLALICIIGLVIIGIWQPILTATQHIH